MRKWWISRWLAGWTRQYCITLWDYPNNIIASYNRAVEDKEYAMIGLSSLWFILVLIPLYLLITPIVFAVNVVLTLLGKLIELIVSLVKKPRQH